VRGGGHRPNGRSRGAKVCCHCRPAAPRPAAPSRDGMMRSCGVTGLLAAGPPQISAARLFPFPASSPAPR